MSKSTHWKKSSLPEELIPWLLQSSAYTAYNTRKFLLGEDDNGSEQTSCRERLLQDSSVMQLVKTTSDWLPRAAGRNNDPKLSYFSLRTLADLGIRASDPGITEIIAKAESHSEDDLYAVRGGHPERPKRGEKFVKPDPEADIWHAAPCNSPVVTSALLALGYESSQLDNSVKALVDKWQTPQGWFCHYHFVNSQFKKHDAGCPIAGLMTLEVFSLVPDLKESEGAKNAFEPLEYHWKFGKNLYYFGRSKKFWTFKYPYVWYNALYLGEVLSRFSFLKGHPLVAEIVDWIESSMDEQGRVKPTSIFMPYKSWDFGNKKEHSPWITFLCHRILKRWYSEN